MNGPVTHVLTLMLPLAMKHEEGGAGESTDTAIGLRTLACPECGRTVTVDLALSRRGNYFCDGTLNYTFYPHRADAPSIMQVFRELQGERGLSGEALETLRLIALQARELAESLEAWIYIYGEHD